MKTKPIIFKNQHHFDRVSFFFEVYEKQKKIFGGLKSIESQSTYKVCRFCDKTESNTTFNQETHIIPQLLKKAKPISTFECDSCNELFSQFESDFGHFFLLERAFLGHRKKKSGAPKFKTEKGTIIQKQTNIEELIQHFNLSEDDIKSLQSEEKRIIAINEDDNQEELLIDKTQNKCFIKITRKPYRPLNVYKVFLKIGFSLLDETELNKYSILKNILINETDVYATSQFCLFGYRIPYLRNFYGHAVVQLFKRKNEKYEYSEKTLVIYFGNSMYQIPFFSDTDFAKMKTKANDSYLLKISPYLNPIVSKMMKEGGDEKLLEAIENSTSFENELSNKGLIKDDIESIELLLNEITFLEENKN